MTSPTSTATSPVLGQQPAADTDTGTDVAATSTVLGQQPATDTGGAVAVYGAIDPDSDDPTIATKTAPSTVGVYYGADGRQYHASPFSKATKRNLADGTWSIEEPAPVEVFDPTKKKVQDIVAHLNEHAHDAEEVARVRAAEAAGEDRVTIRDWPPAE